MRQYLYRVQIVEYPEGAIEDQGEHYTTFASDWEPEDWKPSHQYIETFGTSKFIWPTTYKEWKSRSSAVKRKELIESYGAKAIIQRSSRIVWPEDGQEYVR
jgi:hypothetical protein